MKRKAPPVRIRTVSFRANVPADAQFNHIHIEATADVPRGARPEDILDGLKDFVAVELIRAKREREKQVPKRPRPVSFPEEIRDRLEEHEDEG